MFCREQAAHFTETAQTFEDQGYSLAIIGNGTAQHLTYFLEDHPTDVQIFTDPDRKAYGAFELVHGFGGLSGIKMLGNSLRAMRGGHKQGRTAGDPLQQGGIVVINTDSQVLYTHRDSTAGDHITAADLLDRLKG